MHISKKGQGISINTIVIAAIALLVLVILALLISNSATNVSDGTSCIENAGVCKRSCEPTHEVEGSELCKTDYHCCSPIKLRNLIEPEP